MIRTSQTIPLTLQVDDQQFVDDASFDQAAFIKAVAASPNCPKSACPSPGAFLEAYQKADADMIFVVTLSQHLSGTYNSAVMAKTMFEQQKSSKKIAVIGSDSASSGETLVGLEIQRLAEQGLEFEEIEKGARSFLKEMKTYFVLESLEALRKNGRLTGLQAFFASALNIKPVMGSDSGTIIKLSQARGIKKALDKMIEIFVNEVKDSHEKVLGIAHWQLSGESGICEKDVGEKTGLQKSIYHGYGGSRHAVCQRRRHCGMLLSEASVCIKKDKW